MANVEMGMSKTNEEQRKLQMTGGSTYILSLPKDWVVRNQLDKGSSMTVREEDDGSLSIVPSKLAKREKQDEAFIRVSANDNPNAVMRTAISAYTSWLQCSPRKSQRPTNPTFNFTESPQKFRKELLGWNRNRNGHS